MSKKLLNLLLVVMMLAVLVPTALAAPPAQEGQDYVVVADDWLSKLADKYLGNPMAYPAIVNYTNRKHAEDASYATINDPNLIEIGWKIYIPNAEEAAKVLGGAPAAEAVTIRWWSHWAAEPAKVAVVEKIAADYEAEHPNVDIEVVWWDKNPLRDAIRSTMTAGEGAPDITTFDTDMREWVEAGWMMDLTDVLPWDNLVASAQLDGVYPGIDGIYKFNIALSAELLLYNPDIFAELGIEVPDDYTFTRSEYLDMVQKCNAAGYAGVANAIGNRPHTGRRVIENLLFPYVGQDIVSYMSGQRDSVDTPEFRRTLEYMVELADAGLLPSVYATMTIDEYHVYFHTQHAACTLFNPTWYVGRAFKPVDEGGQDPNWHFGFLRVPADEDAPYRDKLRTSFESGYGILTQTKYPEVAKDILAFAAQPKYGALWTAVTNIPAAIKYDVATDWPSEELQQELGAVPGQWDWYWEEFNKVYTPMEQIPAPSGWCSGDYEDAWVTMINEGLPQKLVTVDEAIETIDAAVCGAQ
jgi:ABC-type glycerol-3-phosphate transport system substrate-binding protein